MRQYLGLKAQHPDAILFFRLGDFYEMFFEDAVVASAALDLTLTSRDKNKPDPIPMCGVPHHAASGYVRRLVEGGHRVAICEQVEDPRTARGVVKRSVTQVITPGVVLDSEQLDARSNNYLAAVYVASPEGGTGAAEGKGGAATYGIALADVSTFDLEVTELNAAGLLDELARRRPKEVVTLGLDESERAELEGLLPGAWKVADVALGRDVAAASALLEQRSDGGFVRSSAARLRVGLQAASLALLYAETTQPGRELCGWRVRAYRVTDFLQLDEASLAHLEILGSSMDGKREGSLLATLDGTLTPMGGRLLRQWLIAPLLDVAAIRRRQDAVELLVACSDTRASLRAELARVGDLERLATRAVLELANPRELSRLADSLARLPALCKELAEATEGTLTRERSALLVPPDDLLGDLARRLAEALVEDPPRAWNEGGVFRKGLSAELDEVIDLAEGSRSAIVALEKRLRERTGINSLKVRYNRVFGYFIEVTRANLKHVPDDFRRRQTLANAERFTTAELGDYEARVLSAQERRGSLEQEMFEALRREVASCAGRLMGLAHYVATLDVTLALAAKAASAGYSRPVVDESRTLSFEQSRHPVVEAAMPAGDFVPNDIALDADDARLLVITGPNMAGKSTAIRQVALLTLMAQMGSFLPCRRAHVGLVDRIFTRIGAADNLVRGESTFMVEMRETAQILNHASERSLIVLDEIGRGTSTYDGISIAWAVAEHLHDRVAARALFATHYHELCQLADIKPHAHNLAVAVKEWQGQVVFLRKLVAGASSRSYGIEVARLAGLPRRVVSRAREVLAALEGEPEGRGETLPRLQRPAPTDRQLGLFGGASAPGIPMESEAHRRNAATKAGVEHPPLGPSEIEQELAGLDPQRMTPLEALTLLDSLVTKARSL